MTIDQYKNNIVVGLQQSNLTMLISELATALSKNEEQGLELEKLKAELSELKKPIAPPTQEVTQAPTD